MCSTTSPDDSIHAPSFLSSLLYSQNPELSTAAKGGRPAEDTADDSFAPHIGCDSLEDDAVEEPAPEATQSTSDMSSEGGHLSMPHYEPKDVSSLDIQFAHSTNHNSEEKASKVRKELVRFIEIKHYFSRSYANAASVNQLQHIKAVKQVRSTSTEQCTCTFRWRYNFLLTSLTKLFLSAVLCSYVTRLATGEYEQGDARTRCHAALVRADYVRSQLRACRAQAHTQRLEG